jgi:acyl carrier protein
MQFEKEIIDIVKTNISYEGEITIESSLSDDLDIESFDKLMIINALEDTFLIKINENDLENLRSIKDLVEIVRRYSKS